MQLETWDATKNIFKKFHIILTLGVFAYLLSLISKLLLPQLPQQAILLAISILSATGFVNENIGPKLMRAVVRDLDKIPARTHYLFILLIGCLYVCIRWDVIIAYLSRLDNNLRTKIRDINFI